MPTVTCIRASSGWMGVRMKSSQPTLTHAGPSLWGLALVYTSLATTGLVSGVLLKHGAGTVNPFGPAEDARRFFADNPVALQVSSFFQFGSAVSLGIYVATVVSRLRFLGVRAAGSHIALFGGFVASTALMISGLFAWVLSVPEVAESLAATRLAHFMTFLLGGPGFAVGFGLLTAGVSITGYFFRLLPRWVIWFGLVIAAAGELSSLSLLTLWATPLIPVVRFFGFIWLIAAGATLPKTISAITAPGDTVLGPNIGIRDEAA